MEDRPLVLAADRNSNNLEILSQVLGRWGYDSLAVSTLEDLDEALMDATTISLALIDLGGFNGDIWPRCDTMRQAGIPFLIISPQGSVASQRAGLQSGAQGVLMKPLVADELRGLIGNLLGY